MIWACNRLLIQPCYELVLPPKIRDTIVPILIWPPHLTTSIDWMLRIITHLNLIEENLYKNDPLTDVYGPVDIASRIKDIQLPSKDIGLRYS